MPRLNIYIPDELDLAIRQFSGEINLSRVCASAIRAELSARNTMRSPDGPFPQLHRHLTRLDDELMAKFPLRLASVLWHGSDTPRETVAWLAGDALTESLVEGQDLAIGGGSQMWDIARRLTRRNLGMRIWALGYGDVDRVMPHLHPNALVTLLAMLYGSRCQPMLVGAPGMRRAWEYPARYPSVGSGTQRHIIGSCAMFDADSPYARVLGEEMTTFLVEEHVMGDFLGVFITGDGRILEPYAPSMTVSHISASDLQQLAKRDDTHVILASTGGHKRKLVQLVLELGLCNTLVTDDSTAEELLS